MSSTTEPSPSGTPSNCPYGFCGDYCLETSSSVCCTGSSSGNSSGTVQCGNNWFCSETPGQCCPSASQVYCSGADACIDASAGQTCCGPTWCPQNQTCASSGDRCCPNTQTVCATDWWLVPVSTSVTVISMTTTPTAHPTTTTSSKTGTSSTNTPTSTPSSSSGLGTGAKAGIAVGAIIAAVALVGLLLFFLRKRPNSRSRTGPMYAATGISEYEPATTYNNGGQEQTAYHSGYEPERRETIPLVTTTPPVHDEAYNPPEYPLQDEHPGQEIFSQHAPSYPTIPRE
ncbi:uncharacterized protein LY89DRAFT_787351 [Mollisia scopiformis]|uniref:Uncharacterized protein n=1 Tax=Mollisia scopiformis TaxID=149040 RepID=A0A132BF07_MOLSC|nr:uncharacterized protein LY89DRAFT_787351 [Mollisia scopiformis]KUJ10287.1 hypothetical protein LY89DRAFT_787351 [Mollisia scopiformis]